MTTMQLHLAARAGGTPGHFPVATMVFLVVLGLIGVGVVTLNWYSKR